MVEEYEVLMQIWEEMKPYGICRVPMICMLIDLLASDEGRDPGEVAARIHKAVVDCNKAFGGI